MSETTTVRVQKTTRDLLREAAETQHVTFDTLIKDALKAYEWEKVLAQAAEDANRIAADPREAELARKIADDFADMRENEPWAVPGVPPGKQPARRLPAAKIRYATETLNVDAVAAWARENGYTLASAAEVSA